MDDTRLQLSQLICFRYRNNSASSGKYPSLLLVMSCFSCCCLCVKMCWSNCLRQSRMVLCLFKKRQTSVDEQLSEPQHPQLSDGIYLQAVSASRGQHCVLRDIDLHFKENKIGLIGDNGSGKSTLARLLNGLVVADKGLISVYGFDAARQAKILPALVGFIFQNPDHQIIFPTVIEELSFGLEQLGHSAPQASQQALSVLTEHKIQDWRDLPVQHLSEGQKQLLCILAVLVMQPRMVVLDEPFSALDLPTRQQMMQVLDKFETQIVMISHDLSVFSGFDRIICLDQGVVVDDGEPAAVIANYQQRHQSK